MHVGNYLTIAHDSETTLADAFRQVAVQHVSEVDVQQACLKLASWSEDHAKALEPFVKHYHERRSPEPENLRSALFRGARKGSLGLVRDLHDLLLLATEVNLAYEIVGQAAKALRDKELDIACEKHCKETQRQINWLHTRIKQAAPQALVVA